MPLKEIYPGDYLVFYLDNCQPEAELTFSSDLFQGTPFMVTYGKGRLGLQGVSYRARPGTYGVRLKVTSGDKTIWEKEEQVILKPKEFFVQHLTVTGQQASQRNAALSAQDAAFCREARARSNPAPLWENEFIQPVEGRVTTEYGQIRYINKVYSGRHAGVDIAAPLGSPVKAANSGIIVLSMKLNVTGNTIIIDHGANLFSSYAHLNRLLAGKGQQVKKGDAIGEMGSTGFSTGPHLHWTVSTGPDFLNPWLLISQDPLSLLPK